MSQEQETLMDLIKVLVKDVFLILSLSTLITVQVLLPMQL